MDDMIVDDVDEALSKAGPIVGLGERSNVDLLDSFGDQDGVSFSGDQGQKPSGHPSG